MATHTGAVPSPSLANLSLSSYDQSNPIDLTLDDDGPNDSFNPVRLAKRPRTDVTPISRLSPSSPHYAVQNGGIPTTWLPQISAIPSVNEKPSNSNFRTSSFLFQGPASLSQNIGPLPTFPRPDFPGPTLPKFFPPRQPQPTSTSPPSPPSTVSSERQVIDLTGSPSPPPAQHAQSASTMLPSDLPPKTPVCIGLLTVTALVLYPVPYLYPKDPNSIEPEWAPVRLHYEHSPNKPGGADTIHIKIPQGRTPNGEITGEEGFGVVEQKVSSLLGPMLGKGLIRLDAKIRRGVNVSVNTLFITFTIFSTFPSASHFTFANARLHPKRQHSYCRQLSSWAWSSS